MRRYALLIGSPIVAAFMLLAAGPAQALSASSAAAGKPTWSRSVLSSGTTTFVGSGSGADTYTAYVYLVRTSSGKSPGCTASSCASSTSQQVWPFPAQVFTSVPKNGSRTLATVSVNCPTSGIARSYWVFVKVVGTGTTTAKVSLSSSLNGSYC